ncbi:hypothetical protein TRFO_14807 [Tritrichomonas foetus]|uniref:Protein kinase domain-containing protein n=1 Tax=Tritrichomonas foetus TaxID=1144522 RepID=A0A1J4KZ31_9EUKA|nr:hypothetical protein TRFO_14807 [Tritrichomonas foetus]|eukprot:OHT14845.1 hypothetical protein TRFO_14807 [Tritrichomonas foetus]
MSNFKIQNINNIEFLSEYKIKVFSMYEIHHPFPQVINEYLFVSCLSTSNSPRTAIYQHQVSQIQYVIRLVQRSDFFDKVAFNEYKKEILRIKNLSHPNIATFKEILCENENFYIVMDYYQNESIVSFIKKNGKFSESAVRVLLMQFLDVLNVICENSITHNDFEPNKILIDKQYKIKVALFGKIPNKEDQSNTTDNNNELAQILNSSSIDDGEPRDIWSCGYILFYITTGTKPFEDSSSIQNMRLCRTGSKIDFPYDMSETLSDLLQKMLSGEPSNRITKTELLKHPWVHNKCSRLKDDSSIYLVICNSKSSLINSNSSNYFDHMKNRAVISNDKKPLITIPETSAVSASKSLNRVGPRKSLQYKRNVNSLI